MSSISSSPDARADHRAEIAVWGDELLEKGDPLGEIIALARDPKNDKEMSSRLFEAQRKYERAHFSDRALFAKWKSGVIDSISVETEFGSRVMDEVLRCPAIRFLRTLDFRAHSDAATTDPMPVLHTHGLPESLRDLTLWLRVGKPSFRRLYSLVRNLERLEIWRPEALGVIDLPQLRVLRTVSFRKPDLLALGRGTLPELERLEIFSTFWPELAGLDLPGSPKLHTLAVARPPWDPWVLSDLEESLQERDLRALVESPIADRVQTVEFHHHLTTETLSAIVVYASWLERFQRVRLTPPKDANIRNELEMRLGKRLEWIL